MNALSSLSLLSLLGATAVHAAAPSSEALKFFEAKVRPLLVEQCQDCHGPTKHKGGLRVDNLPYLIRGGEQGPALVPHKPEQSLLIKAISYADPDMEMPPEGKMSDEDIATLKQWIAMGAPWPEAEVAGAQLGRKPGEITDADRQWWSFVPVKEPRVPEVKSAQFSVLTAKKSDKNKLSTSHSALRTPPRNPIDHFILAKLAENGLQPSPEASRIELIRRLSFDLHGLPPTPEQVTAFVEDERPDAYERLVDGLLASPRYGERWAQHWLDLVRYAESEGYRLDAYRPNVWPYRDYVIKSFNDNKPYAQFVREQIAGDEIAPEDPNVAIGTAFLRHTIYEYNQRDTAAQWKLIMNEVTDVTADVFMGLSVQCAQCHDHKFDPILHKDYYRLQAFFGNITWPEHKLLATPQQVKDYDAKLAAWKEAAKEPLAVIDSIIEPRIKGAQKNALEKFPDEIQATFAKPKHERTPIEEQWMQLANRQIEYERYRFKTDKIKEPEQSRLKAAQEALAQFDHLKPEPLMTAFIIGETGNVGATTKFKSRRTGEVEVKPGFLTILDPSDAKIPQPSGNAATTGRRTVLANWLTREDNPLTWRVMTNRVWQYHFGKGIAGTASDFGNLGEKPVNPELLDWLTSQFIKSGGKIKDLHKLIVMSATYRQSSKAAEAESKGPRAKGQSNADLAASPPSALSPMLKDPDNRLLWRFPPRRLDAEQSRDAILAATGELTPRMGGEGEDASKTCRSIYTRKMRNSPDDFLSSLDMPPGFQSISERQATTTATQSLLMINGDWPLDRARAMAASLLKAQPKDEAEIVRQAYQRVYARQPNASELTAATSFLRNQQAALKRETPPPPPAVSPLASAQRFFGPNAASKTQKTLLMTPGSANEKLRVGAITQLEPEQFAVEAVIYLSSLYPDAGVRTIASRWNNGKTDPGWALGVTSEKSAHKPNNLIMQLSGEDFQGSQLYEAVPSGLRVPLNKPFYVAASIDNHPAPGQTFGSTVTFYARDLSDPAAPMQTATVSSQVVGGWINKSRALYVGGRDADKKSLWHGAIARVALRSGLLDGGKLMSWAADSDPTCVVDVSADHVASHKTWAWESATGAPKGGAALDPRKEAVADLCHALFNSNEFFYLH